MKQLNAAEFRLMIEFAAATLESQKSAVDELNVFPVPDGDTGTNMSHTLTAACEKVKESDANTVGDLASQLSSGALRGARGNSGVILSQLIRGMARELKGHNTANGRLFASSLVAGFDIAYHAVQKPREGTILSVARAVAEAAKACSSERDEIEVILNYCIKEGEKALANTPNQLPVLKQAGVVDAGGKGWMVILHAWHDALVKPEEAKKFLAGFSGAAASASASRPKQVASVGGASNEGNYTSAQSHFKTEDIHFCYCTEMIVEHVKNAESHEEELQKFLTSLGDSLVLVCDDELIKVHVHTNEPDLVIGKGRKLGELTMVKIENMRLQHKNLLEADRASNEAEPSKQPEPVQTPAQQTKKPIGFVVVSSGDGFTEVFKSLGVDEIVTGGQTMNPSTEDLLNAAEKINAETVFILPNNKNIILAAEQAASIEDENQKIIVIPSKSVPQGITAMMNFMTGVDAETAAAAMKESLSNVVSGSVTYAVRDSQIDDFKIQQNDILALMNDHLTVTGKDLQQTSKDLLDKMLGEHNEFITIYYGEGADENTAGELAEYINSKYPNADVTIQNGGQALYYYIISAE